MSRQIPTQCRWHLHPAKCPRSVVGTYALLNAHARSVVGISNLSNAHAMSLASTSCQIPMHAVSFASLICQTPTQCRWHPHLFKCPRSVFGISNLSNTHAVSLASLTCQMPTRVVEKDRIFRRLPAGSESRTCSMTTDCRFVCDCSALHAIQLALFGPAFFSFFL